VQRKALLAAIPLTLLHCQCHHGHDMDKQTDSLIITVSSLAKDRGA
jgi:hypothetical protein